MKAVFMCAVFLAVAWTCQSSPSRRQSIEGKILRALYEYEIEKEERQLRLLGKFLTLTLNMLLWDYLCFVSCDLIRALYVEEKNTTSTENTAPSEESESKEESSTGSGSKESDEETTTAVYTTQGMAVAETTTAETITQDQDSKILLHNFAELLRQILNM